MVVAGLQVWSRGHARQKNLVRGPVVADGVEAVEEDAFPAQFMESRATCERISIEVDVVLLIRRNVTASDLCLVVCSCDISRSGTRTACHRCRPKSRRRRRPTSINEAHTSLLVITVDKHTRNGRIALVAGEIHGAFAA